MGGPEWTLRLYLCISDEAPGSIILASWQVDPEQLPPIGARGLGLKTPGQVISPHAATYKDLDSLGRAISEALYDSGYREATVFIRGSRWTGISREKPGRPAGKVPATSDWDIGIVDKQLFEMAAEQRWTIMDSSKAPRTGVVSAGKMEELGVRGLPSEWAGGTALERPMGMPTSEIERGPVTYKIYETYEGYGNMNRWRDGDFYEITTRPLVATIDKGIIDPGY